jgi:hypothetical protein
MLPCQFAFGAFVHSAGVMEPVVEPVVAEPVVVAVDFGASTFTVATR